MTEAANGVIRRSGDAYDIVFVRRLKQPIEKVWAALTVPERIADWFTDMRFIPELGLGALVEVRFPDDDPPYEMLRGEVVAFEPPRLFAWTWPDSDHMNSIVRCELAPDGDGCVLTFSQGPMGTKHLISVGGGWQVFLDGLEGAADGVRTPGSVEREKALRPLYAAQLGALIDNEANGVVRRTGETYELTFVRRVAQPIEKVWAALTTPERLADWFGDVTFDEGLRVGGRFDLRMPAFDFHTRCQVVALEPPRLFAWTWGLPDGPACLENAIRFELAADGAGCILTLTNPGLVRQDLESVAAGWHTPLAALPDAVDGRATPNTAEREKPYLERYTGAFAALR